MSPPGRTRHVDIDGPLDLQRNLDVRSRRTPCVRFDRDTGHVWRATRCAGAPATVRFARTRRGVMATAWGPGADALLDKVPDLIGLGDAPDALVAAHRVVRDAQRRLPGLRLTRGETAVEALIPAIIGQRVTSTEARDGYRALVLALGEPAPGPAGLYLPPTAQAIAATPEHAMRPLGIDRGRAETLIRACRVARRLEEANTMPPEDAYRRLTAVRGIGPWTAWTVIGRTHGHPDAVPIGDYHLPNLVAWALAGEARADDARMLELLAPYVGQRWRVILLLELAGHRAPKFGPRQQIRGY